MTGIARVVAIATRLTDYVTAVAVSVSMLFMAINGVRLIVSAGNPRRQAEARSGLLAAALGLVLALSAGLLAQLLVGALR